MKDKDTNCCFPSAGPDKNIQTESNMINQNKTNFVDSAWREASDNEDASDWEPTASDLQCPSGDSCEKGIGMDHHVKER